MGEYFWGFKLLLEAKIISLGLHFCGIAALISYSFVNKKIAKNNNHTVQYYHITLNCGLSCTNAGSHLLARVKCTVNKIKHKV